jgi:tetratricopeptide (TPR) repeat protein
LAAVIALLAGTWWLAQTPPAEVQPPNMSVLIADFENRTNDPVFEGALEQALGIEIEGAPFIHAYPRRDAMRIGAQIDAIDAGGRLTERAARLVSVREGIQVILAGSVVPSGSGYEIVVKAIDLGADRPISTVSAKASDKPGVLKAVGAVAKNLRRDLGDVTLEDSGAGGREMLTTASLEAVREFAVGLDLQRAYKDEEAIEHYKRAVSLDANFGRAYSGWGNAASRLGREDESREAWAKALALVDRMSEREKYRTLGLYYGTVTRNYPKALESYENLVKLFPADGAGHNNLALAYFNTLNFKQALESGKRARDIYPQNLLYQGNYALYAMYAGDFATAAAEAQRVVKSQAEYYPAYLPQAIAALANGDLAAAREVYGRMASTGTPGASIASLGVADLAAYSGRFAEAVDRLKQGVAEDEKTGNRSARGVKLAALAEIHADMGDLRRAARFAREAVSVTRQPGVVVASARVLARARQSAAVGPLVSGLERDLQPHPRAYAQIIQGEIAARNGRTIEAVEAFQSGRKLADLWLGRLQLGIAYVEAGHYAEGLSELDEALKRQGEATALFLDDMPTFRYLADLPYWVARAHAGLGAQEPAIREFRRFLDTRGANRRAPYVADAGRRLAALSQTR